MEITIATSHSSDSKEPKNGKQTHALHHKKSHMKKQKKEKKKRLSIVAAAKATIDPNMFSIDDTSIEDVVENLGELSVDYMDNADFESSGKCETAMNTNVHSTPESLPQISAPQKEDMPFEEAQQQQKVPPPTSNGGALKSSKIGRQISKDDSMIKRQSSTASQDAITPVSRQVSSFSWMGSKISRQNSWFSRQDSQAESEEPDEETPEEKATRVAALRYYPIAFNVDQ